MPIYASNEPTPTRLEISKPRIGITLYPVGYPVSKMPVGAQTVIELPEDVGSRYVRAGVLRKVADVVETTVSSNQSATDSDIVSKKDETPRSSESVAEPPSKVTSTSVESSAFDAPEGELDGGDLPAATSDPSPEDDADFIAPDAPKAEITEPAKVPSRAKLSRGIVEPRRRLKV